MDLTNMNEMQIKAIKKTEGPLLVLAGAGSGKTRVLTTRIAYLIEELNVLPDSILAITFTNKAAKEMKERVYNLIDYKAKSVWISTFHSFGLKLIKENYDILGYNKNFTILDSDDSLIIIKKIIKSLNLDIKKYNPKAIKAKISGAKNEMLTPIQYELYANTDFEKIVVAIYKEYEKKLKINNSVDFDDLLLLPVQLLKNNLNILNYYQEKYKYILVDEYQDTNSVQYVLTKIISTKYKNICVVGDSDQAIYSWRGANYKNILNFENDYKNAEIILLEQNYRSTEIILNAANNVISNNKERKDKKLWSSCGVGEKIIYKRCYDEKDEAHYIAMEIIKLFKLGADYNDISILYRTNAQSRVIEEEMLKNNIPYKVIGSFHFYNRKEIKDLISYLKLIFNSKDDISLLRSINTPKRGIGSKAVSNLANIAFNNNKSMYESLTTDKELKFKNIIESIKNEISKLTLTELIDLVLEKSGIRDFYKKEKTLDSEIRLENLEEFKSITKGFEERLGNVSLSDFLDEISLVTDYRENKDDSSKVTLMTMHSVKGLEYNDVFVMGMEEGLFPHSNSFVSNYDMEEERRLCYVAITRARKKLYITNAKRRVLFGKEQNNLPSRFIKEIGNDYIEYVGTLSKIKESFDKKSAFVEGNISYSVGDHVFHEKYGEGIIVFVEDRIIKIAFESPFGIKQMMKNHKSIRKL